MRFTKLGFLVDVAGRPRRGELHKCPTPQHPNSPNPKTSNKRNNKSSNEPRVSNGMQGLPLMVSCKFNGMQQNSAVPAISCDGFQRRNGGTALNHAGQGNGGRRPAQPTYSPPWSTREDPDLGAQHNLFTTTKAMRFGAPPKAPKPPTVS